MSSNIPKSSSNVPSNVRSLYNEAVKCFEIRAYNAVVGLCKAIITLVANDCSIKSRTMCGKIESLYKRGLITHRIKQRVNKISLLSAEKNNLFTTKKLECQDFLCFTHELIECIYSQTGCENEKYVFNYDHFVDTLRNTKFRKGALAKELGVHRNTIGDLVRGVGSVRVPIDLYIGICNKLNLPITHFLEKT